MPTLSHEMEVTQLSQLSNHELICTIADLEIAKQRLISGGHEFVCHALPSGKRPVVSIIQYRIAPQSTVINWLRHQLPNTQENRELLDDADLRRQYRVRWIYSMIKECKQLINARAAMKSGEL